MKADASRIEIVTFRSIEQTAARGATLRGRRVSNGLLFFKQSLERRRSSTARPLGADDDAQHFDVRNASCSKVEDADKLLSAIETCGGGFEAFNNWLRALIELSRRRAQRDPARAKWGALKMAGTRRALTQVMSFSGPISPSHSAAPAAGSSRAPPSASRSRRTL